MYITIFRTMILYFTVVIAMRIMGKRQIGELQPFELAIAIMISDLASFPMEDTRIPLIHGVIPIMTLIILQVILSVIQLKSERTRSIISGRPTILVNKGLVNIKNLKDQRYNINDLLEELRLNGYFNLKDIDYAILETSGKISILPKLQATPTTKKDLNIRIKTQELPYTLITDGKIHKENLKACNKDINWLNNQLKQNYIDSTDEIFIALIDSESNFYFQKKEGK